MKEKVLSILKNYNTYRYIVSVVFILEAIYRTIIFTNAGSNVEQAEFFRPLCIGLAVVVLINMEIRDWFNIWSLIYIPVCYLATKVAYSKHWLFDINNYEFPGLIRLGKIVILLWGIVIISLVRYVIKHKSWTKIKNYYLSVLIPFGLYCLCIILFRRHYAEMIFFMVAVIGLAFVMREDSRRKLLIKAVMDAILLSFVYVMYMSLRHRPFDLERYDLIFSNSNHAGAYLATVVVALFCKANIWWKKEECKRWQKITALIVYYIVLGIAISVALFNYTRTTLAGLGFAFIAALVVNVIKSSKGAKGKTAARYGLVIAALVVTFNITYLGLRYIPAYYAAYVDSPIYYIGENDPVVKVQYGDSINSPKYTSMNNYLRMVFGKWGVLIKFDDDKESEKQEESVVFDGRDVTGGRMEIWSLFLSKANLTGHYPFHVYDEEENIIPHSHNSYIMVAHMLGMIAGVIYIIYTISMFIRSLLTYKKEEDKDAVYLFTFLMIATCMISQVSEWISRPQYCLYMISMFAFSVVLSLRRDK